MSSHDKEKHDLEKAAVNWFLPQYNILKGEIYSVDWQERPDAVLKYSDGRKLGIEITHLYYDQEESRYIFGRSNKKQLGTQCFINLLNKLNDELEKKAKKSFEYECDFPISLLIRSASDIFIAPDFKRAKSSIIIPKNAFKEIWLLAQAEESFSRSWELIHLYSAK